MDLSEMHLQLFEKGEYIRFIAIVQAKNLTLDKDLIHKLALAYFHTENYKEASKLFLSLAEKTKDALAWFNYANSALANKDTQTGLKALETALNYNKETKTDGEGIPPAFMLFYACQSLVNVNDYHTALLLLDRLSIYYKTEGKTSDAWLYEKAIPMFDEFCCLVATILPQIKELDKPCWIDSIAEKLDGNGKGKLEQLKATL